jgi:hypothetical protein
VNRDQRAAVQETMAALLEELDERADHLRLVPHHDK